MFIVFALAADSVPLSYGGKCCLGYDKFLIFWSCLLFVMNYKHVFFSREINNLKNFQIIITTYIDMTIMIFTGGGGHTNPV